MAFWITNPVVNLFSMIAGATNWFGVCKDEAIIPKYLIGKSLSTTNPINVSINYQGQIG